MDINFNFNHMWSKVLRLPESIGPLNDFYNSDTYISNVRGRINKRTFNRNHYRFYLSEK